MARRVPEEGKSLVSNLSELGKDAVKGFGKPVLEMDYDDANMKFLNGSIQPMFDNSAGGGQEIQINLYGDVDSEERLNYFVERIRRELSWNNRTAGRGV
jgi:hypothetical protein